IDEGLPLFERQTGGAAVLVRQSAAGGGDGCLADAPLVQFDSTLGEPPLDTGELFVVGPQIAFQKIADRLPGEVVVGGSESAAGDDEIGFGGGTFDFAADERTVV